MPLQGAHVFASHIGHTGKTTLCYQLSCSYARRHPSRNVLVMDLAEEGDLSKRLLGGVDQSAKREELFGSIFSLLEAADKKAGQSRLVSWVRGADLNLAEHAIRVHDHNPNVPANLFLISSGAWPKEDAPMDVEVRKRICAKIREALTTHEKTWKLFCDTDGDRRPSPNTLLGYTLCEHAIVPLTLNKGDLDRIATMFGVMNELRAAGEIETQVELIVWNCVKAQKDERMRMENGWELPFTPSKVSVDILNACSKRLLEWARDEESLPGLFVHSVPDGEEVAWLRNSCAMMRMLADNVLKPSEEMGLPFAVMVDQLHAKGTKKMKFVSAGERLEDRIAYEADTHQIEGGEAAVRAIAEKFEAMRLG